MLRIIWTALALAFIVSGIAGILAAGHDLDSKIKENEYIYLEVNRAFGDKRLISPVFHHDPSDSGWTSYPPLAKAFGQPARSKLFSAKLGASPISLAIYSSAILFAGLLLSALPPGWRIWQWLVRPAFAKRRRIAIAARAALVLILLALIGLAACSALDPGGLINVAASPVDQFPEDSWNAWVAGWTSTFVQNIRCAAWWCTHLMIVAVTVHFVLLFTAQSNGTKESRSE